MQIQVINVSTTSHGKYSMAEVAYKNLATGKVESKKIPSFTEVAYKALVDAKNGDNFEVKAEKDAKNYWQWVDVKQLAPGAAPAPQQAGPGTGFKPTGTFPQRDFETSEERAKKQVFIVRQSSLSTAANLLSVGAKTPPTKEAVLELAQEFTDWVFAQPKPTVEKLADMQDDIPY